MAGGVGEQPGLPRPREVVAKVRGLGQERAECFLNTIRRSGDLLIMRGQEVTCVLACMTSSEGPSLPRHLRYRDLRENPWWKVEKARVRLYRYHAEKRSDVLPRHHSCPTHRPGSCCSSSLLCPSLRISEVWGRSSSSLSSSVSSSLSE